MCIVCHGKQSARLKISTTIVNGQLTQVSGGTMLEYHTSIIINRTPQDVFAFITDPQNLGTYRLDLASYEMQTDGGFAKGTRWLEHGIPLGSKEIIGQVEVVDFIPDKQFTICTTTDKTPFYTVYAVEPVAEGTRLSFYLKGELPGFLKMLEPIIKRRVASATEMNFEHLKLVMETTNK
jgi:carbon monoxide dehydrogenase subunit G